MSGICCLINASLSEALLEGVRAFQKCHGIKLPLKVHYAHELEEERTSTALVRKDLAEADLVLLDLRGSGRATALCGEVLQDAGNTVVALVGGSPEIMQLVRMGGFSLTEIMARGNRKEKPATNGPNIQRMQNIMRWAERLGDAIPVGTMRHIRNWNRTMRYWAQGGPENVQNMLTFLSREYLHLDLPKPLPPQEYPAYGIYDPHTGTRYTSRDTFRAATGFDPAKPTVGILLYGGMHFAQSATGARALAERLAPEVNVLPVFSESHANHEAVREFFFEEGRPCVDAIAYFQWFQFASFGPDAAGTIPLFKELDVPVFAMAPMYGREVSTWRESIQGLSPIEVMTTVIMPELDGMIEPVPCLGLVEEHDHVTGQTIKRVHPIPEQMDLIARRVLRRVNIRSIPTPKKRVAFILYDTPPGEENIGNTSYLDVFASIRACMEQMAKQGYVTDAIPPNKEICRLFIETGAVNNARWVPQGKSLEGAVTVPVNDYLTHFEALFDPQEIIDAWGVPPGEIMAGQGKLILPCLEFGNVLLGLQPARGFHSDPEKLTHDKTLPPHHQYIGFYRWLEHDWKADAVIHVGTHGTLEFLKGKEVGQSHACFPANLIGSVPHLYIYHVVNPSEATIAKRRSLGTLVNYNSPPLTISDVYEEYAELENEIAEYLEAKAHDPARADRLEQRVLNLARKLNFDQNDVHEIQEDVARMKRSLIPKGLHVMGTRPDPEKTAETVVYYLRQDRGEVPSLHRVLATMQGLDYDRLLDHPGKTVDGVPNSRRLEEIESEALQLMRETLQAGSVPHKGDLAASLAWGLEVFSRMGGTLEIEALLHGLEGGYTEPGIGGEPCRDPETLPTGRNSYQFDPRLVPSEAAYERGREIAENTLQHYFELHGRWPESVAVIHWAFETAKTRGETVGQIFGYLGLRPVRKNPWKTTLEVLPLEELGRPRIDVTVQICGFSRDMFANVISLINQGMEIVAQLDEPDEMNYVKPHTREMLERIAATMPEDKARRVASARVFGPRAGEYGTRVTHLIETGAWKSEQDIVDTFTASMNHLYADNIHGERHAEVYNERISRVELVSQVRDTNDYEIGDLDHYYEYFGGLTRVVEAVRGEAPVQLITDTTGERMRTETVQKSLEHGTRTRLLNPKWIDHMLEHDVHGAQKVAERVENLVGFSATTHAVEDWVYSAVAERYLFDDVMRERMRDNNPYATEEIARRLFEANKRGYWAATDEEMEKLTQVYLGLEGDIEDTL